MKFWEEQEAAAQVWRIVYLPGSKLDLVERVSMIYSHTHRSIRGLAGFSIHNNDRKS